MLETEEYIGKLVKLKNDQLDRINKVNYDFRTNRYTLYLEYFGEICTSYVTLQEEYTLQELEKTNLHNYNFKYLDFEYTKEGIAFWREYFSDSVFKKNIEQSKNLSYLNYRINDMKEQYHKLCEKKEIEEIKKYRLKFDGKTFESGTKESLTSNIIYYLIDKNNYKKENFKDVLVKIQNVIEVYNNSDE